MDLYQPHFSGLLTEGLKNMSCYETLRKVELNVEVLESDTQFPIWVSKICQKCNVTIQKLRRIKVDDTEACCRGVKHRGSRFDSNEDDQSCDAKEDEEEAKQQTQDCPEPYNRISPPRLPEDRLLSCSKLVASYVRFWYRTLLISCLLR